MHLSVEARARLPAHLSNVGEVGRRTALAGSLFHLVEQERERLVEELDGLEQRVRVAGLEGLLCVQHPVLPQRVLDDERDRLLGPDELRDELRPAPAGNEAEEYLRAGEVADRRRDRPVVAVQRDLHTAAERRPVHCCDRDERQFTEAAEELVPGLTAETSALGRDLAELADVRADGEDEGLAGQEQPAPVARAELVEGTFERAERFLAERVRLLPVLAVVHRHERDRPDARRDLLELELGRVASHRLAGSPRGSRRPSRARCRAR